MEYLEKLFKNISYLDDNEVLTLFSFLDTLRNQLTEDQYISLLSDIYEHADEIYNDIQEHFDQGMSKLQLLAKVRK